MLHVLSIWLLSPPSLAPACSKSDFARWGYPRWWCFFTGGLEIMTAVLIALPASRSVGLALGAVIIAAAVLTVLRHRAEAPPRRRDRHLSAGAARSRRSDRGDDRRDRRYRQGRPYARYRALRGRRGDHPPGGGGPSDRRPADRIFAGRADDRREILPTCRKLGIRVTAYGVLARGLISGHWSKARADTPDFRRFSSRFAGENLDHNLALVEAFRKLARARGDSVAATAVAWALAQGRDIVPLVGARRRAQWAESAPPGPFASGSRPRRDRTADPQRRRQGRTLSGAAAMAHLDSERHG